jgi:hypothetical protein
VTLPQQRQRQQLCWPSGELAAATAYCWMPLPMLPSILRTPSLLCCSKALSQRVSVYSKKLVGEQDALAVEVRSVCSSCITC